jgi:ABC-2 type transport system ATP-binding protein
MACGLTRPTSGSIQVLGEPPAASPTHLAKVGFVAQDTPVYAALTVAEHLRMGSKLNDEWDQDFAEGRLAEIGLDPGQRAGDLSGGQRAQLALTIAAAKWPQLLILDEPAAALDPMARRAFMESVTAFVTNLGASAILSSHLMEDIERACTFLIVLSGGRVLVADHVEVLLATHRRMVLTGHARVPAHLDVINVEARDGRLHALVRADGDAVAEHEAVRVGDLVLGYLTGYAQGTVSHNGPSARVVGVQR